MWRLLFSARKLSRARAFAAARAVDIRARHRRWIVKTIAMPRDRSSHMSVIRFCATSSDSEDVGSSMKRILASKESAFAISISCCWATLRSEMRASGLSRDPTMLKTRSVSLLSTFRSTAPNRARELSTEVDVLRRRAARNQVDFLENHGDAKTLRLTHAPDLDLGGQLDLSVGSCMGLGGVLAAHCTVDQHMGDAAALTTALAAGALYGAFNGALVVGLRLNSLIATLDTGLMGRGAIYAMTNSMPVNGFSRGLRHLGVGYFWGLRNSGLDPVGAGRCHDHCHGALEVRLAHLRDRRERRGGAPFGRAGRQAQVDLVHNRRTVRGARRHAADRAPRQAAKSASAPAMSSTSSPPRSSGVCGSAQAARACLRSACCSASRSSR